MAGKIKRAVGIGAVVGVVVIILNAFSHDQPDRPSQPEEASSGTSENASKDAFSPQSGFRADAPLISGNVLPFTLIQATRNVGMKSGPDAYVSVMVNGGSRGDWAATAAYLGQAIMNSDAETGKVDVSIDNPWGDRSPTEYKTLASVFINKHPHPEDIGSGFDVLLADKIAPMSLIEADEYENELAETLPSQVSDAELSKLEARNDKKAKAYIIKKYKLPKSWHEPTINPYGLVGDSISGERVQIDGISPQVDKQQIIKCLHSNEGAPLVKGCLAHDDFPYIIPDDQRRAAPNNNASDILMADIEPKDKCSVLTRFIHQHKPSNDKDKFGNNLFFVSLMLSAGLSQEQIKGEYMDLLVGMITGCKQNPDMSIQDSMKDAAQRFGLSED